MWARDLPEQLVTVASYATAQEAQIVKGLLESHGHLVFLQDEHTIRIYRLYSNALGGVKVQVPSSELAAAREVLDSAPDASARRTEPEADWGICPRCGNRDVELRLNIQPSLFSLVRLAFLFFRPKDELECRGCRHVWKGIRSEVGT